MKPTLEESKLSISNIHESIIPKILPKIIEKPTEILELSELSKTKTHPSTYQNKFHSILEYHPNHFDIFTNGSKDNDKTACAAI